MLSDYDLDSLELNDPLDRIDRRLTRYGLAPLRRSRAKEPNERLSEQETDSILKSIGNVVLPPLAVVGNILDTPGSFIRGTLKRLTSGKGLGDSLAGGAGDMFDWKNRTSGRDLARQWGWAGKTDNWKNFLGGLALDIGLDPMTFASFGLTGGLTQAGKQLSKVTKLRTLAPTVAAAKGAAAVRPEINALVRAGKTETEAIRELLRRTDLVDDVGQTAIKSGGAMAGRKLQGRLTPADFLTDRNSLEYRLFERNVGGPAEAAKLLDQPIAASMGIGVPFTPFQKAVDLSWVPGAKRLSRLREGIGSAVRLSPVGRAVAGLFDGELRGTYHTKSQSAARAISQGMEDASAAARAKGFQHIRTFHDLIDSGLDPKALEQAAWYKYERVGAKNRLRAGGPETYGPMPLDPVGPDVDAFMRKLAPEQRSAFRQTIATMRREKDAAARAVTIQGGYVPTLQDTYVSHAPRSALNRGDRFGDGRLHATTFGNQSKRAKSLREIPGGTASLNRMGNDPRLVGANRLMPEDAAAILMSEYGIALPKKAEFLAHRLAKRELGNIYAPVTASHVRYLEGAGRTAANLSGLTDLARYAQPILAHTADDLVPFREVLRDIPGIRGRNAKGKSTGLTPYIEAQLGNKLNRAQQTTDLELAEFGLPKDLASEVRKLRKVGTDDATSEFVQKVIDSPTALFKTGVTSIFPAFHARNLLSGKWNAVLSGVNPITNLGTEKAALQLLTRGKGVAEALEYPAVQIALAKRGLEPTVENATRLLQESTFAQDLIGMYRNSAHVGIGFDDPAMFASSIPGLKPMGIRKAFRQGWKQGTLNPLDVRGFNGRVETGFAPGKIGENIGWLVESGIRLPAYMTLLKKGWSPAAAAERVGLSNVRYSGRYYSPFENAVMRRLIPFYSFQKGMTSHVLRELAANPGGRYGQMIRLENRLQENTSDRPLPDYIAQATAMPWFNQPTNGDLRVLGGLNMMHDPALGYLAPLMAAPFDIAGLASESGRSSMGRRARAGLQELAGQLNPLLKAPIEWTSGRSFFQKGPEGGRDISEMDPLVARTISNIAETFGGGAGDSESHIDPKTGKPISRPLPWTANFWEHIVANSPLARLLSSARVGFDPRKTKLEKFAQLGLGLRVNDVSQAAMEKVVNEAASARLAEYPFSKQYDKSYIPLDVLAQLDPQSDPVMLDALLKALSRRTQLRAKGMDLPPLGQGPAVPF